MKKTIIASVALLLTAFVLNLNVASAQTGVEEIQDTIGGGLTCVCHSRVNECHAQKTILTGRSSCNCGNYSCNSISPL